MAVLGRTVRTERSVLNTVWLIVGVLVLAGATLDALWTTLWVDGHAGPFTGRHTSLTRRLALALAGRRHRLLSLVGPFVLVSTVLAWALLMWAGWVAVFSASAHSLAHAHTGAPASLVDRIYFTGYTLFTLGNGDFAPQGHVWELATSVVSLSGLFFVTLAVTYLLAVLEAVVQKRSFASQVTALGRTPSDFILHCWNGAGFPHIELLIVSMTEQLNLVTEQHTAYPLLHYYHESSFRQSVPVGLAIFSEAVTLLERGVAPEYRPAPAALHCARESIRSYLETLRQAYISPSDSAVQVPELGLVRAAGVPVVPDEEFAASLDEVREQRRLITAFLESERREWPRGRA